MSKSVSTAPTNHPVILIGSSAGGLHALQDFFSNIAVQSDTTYVVVQHLGAHFESQLSTFNDVQSVLKKQEAFEHLARGNNGSKILVRISPFTDIEPSGAVLTFTPLTAE